MRTDNYKLKHSQNFLKSLMLVEKLINMSSIGKSDIVYEIGPGKGIITAQLAKKCRKVIAIELDEKLYKKLLSRFRASRSVEIIHGDFLRYRLPKGRNYKVFANIPFNVTSDIVAKLTSYDTSLLDAYLIVQKEAAERFAGRPYAKECQYSLLLKPYFQMKVLYFFKKKDFSPKTSVDVVLLRIKLRKKALIKKSQRQLYKNFIVYGFSQWKVSVRKALKKVFTYRQFMRLARDLGFSKDAKPTDLSFEQWMGLFRFYKQT